MENDERKFEDLSEEQKKNIIRMCVLTMLQQVNKTDDRLEENKEGIKKFIYESETKKGLRSANLQMEFIDFIGDYIIKHKERYSGLPTFARERKVLEEMVKEGIIETAERKRKPEVDFSKLDRPDLLCTDKKTGKKAIRYGKYSEGRRNTQEFQYKGKTIRLTRIGKMEYKTAFMVISNIDEYLVQTPQGESEVFTYGLNIGKIEADEAYRKLFFEQLISNDNMNLEGGNGYIGDIVASGDEQDKYKIEYSDERYSAVKELKARLAQLKEKQEEEKKAKDEEKRDASEDIDDRD